MKKTVSILVRSRVVLQDREDLVIGQRKQRLLKRADISSCIPFGYALVVKPRNGHRKMHISWSFPHLRRTALLRPGQVSNVRVIAMEVR